MSNQEEDDFWDAEYTRQQEEEEAAEKEADEKRKDDDDDYYMRRQEEDDYMQRQEEEDNNIQDDDEDRRRQLEEDNSIQDDDDDDEDRRRQQNRRLRGETMNLFHTEPRINIFHTKPTIEELKNAQWVYLIFRGGEISIDPSNVKNWVEKAGIEASKQKDVITQIVKWGKEAKVIQKTYEVCTNGLTFRIIKHYRNWLGIKTWKWVIDSKGFFVESQEIDDMWREIGKYVGVEMAKKNGWRKVSRVPWL